MDETAERGTGSTDGGERKTESDDGSPGLLTRAKTVVSEAVGVVVDAVIDAL